MTPISTPFSGKAFRASYHLPFEVTRDGDQFHFSGQSDLGKLSDGVYTYHGEATPARFHAEYRSKYDHSRFEMSRPEVR